MLTVRTKLHQFPVKGIGVLADEDIKEGQVVFIHDQNFTKFFSNDDFKKLDSIQKAFIEKHATKYPDGYWLDTDDTRFLNHSSDPNIRFTGKQHDQAVALRVIKKGDEITVNYQELNPNHNVDYSIPNTGQYSFDITKVTLNPNVVPYQLCPKCSGQGTVSKPPYVAGDQHHWTGTSAGPFPCDVCQGTKVIPMAVVN